MMDKQYEAALNFLHDAEFCEDRMESDSLIFNAISISEALIALDNSNPKYCYLMGYCWYNIHGEYEERDVNVEKYLKCALRFDPEDHWAKLYLGHFYFDIKKHEPALSLFSEIDYQLFIDIGQGWRALKLRELIICCKLYETKLASIIEDVTHYLADYNLADEIDRPVQSELTECITKILLLQDYPMSPKLTGLLESILKSAEKNIRGQTGKF